MPFFLKLNNPNCGKMLTVMSVQSSHDRKSENNTAAKHRQTQEPNAGQLLTILCRLLALLLALAVAPTVVFAQEWDQDHEQGHANDPTGAWLIRGSDGSFILTVFHKGGTLTGDIQGESAFLAGSPPPLDVINTPESGVWQKIGAKTFAVTFLTIEYQVTPPTAPVYQFDKVQFTGVLNQSGDQMELTAVITIFNPDGSQKDFIQVPGHAHGVRIPLEVLPNTTHSLSLPQ
jgi:hypothetical protein